MEKLAAKIRDRSAKIVAASPSSSVRPTMVSVLRGLGFENVITVASIDEVIAHRARSPIDWLVTVLFQSEPTNPLQLLRRGREGDQTWREMLISLFVTQEEMTVLSWAYAHGLLSGHAAPFNASQFQETIDSILHHVDDEKLNTSLVAARYLRKHLEDQGQWRERVRLEESIVRLNPGEPAHRLTLAEAAFAAGNTERARAALWNAVQRDASLVARARIIAEKHLGAAASGKRLKVCLIVDSDEAARRTLGDSLAAIGAKTIHEFEGGDEAWEWLDDNPPPDLILMEWRLPKLSGPSLVQRLRGKETLKLVPLIVTSSLIGRTDVPLLQEMGVTTLVEKPVRRSDLINAIAWSVEQTSRPTDPSSVVTKIRGLLATDGLKEAQRIMETFARDVSPDDPEFLYLQAEFAFHLGDFTAARDIATKSLAGGGRSVLALNVLGKSLMQLREFSKALQVFALATEVSPQSIERLCAVAETKNELGDDDGAVQTLAQAATLDAGNQKLVNTSVNIGLATGNKELVEDQFENFKPNESILAYVNNRAVAFAKAGNFSEGIKLYNNALSALPADKPKLKQILLYNLALSQIQCGDPNGAQATLAGTDVEIDQQLGRKIKSLGERLDEAIATGKPMRLNQNIPSDSATASKGRFESLSKRFRPASVAPQSIFCCHGIFTEPDPPSELAAGLAIESVNDKGKGRRSA